MYDAFQIPPLILRADPQMQLGLHYTACAHALIAVAIHLALSVGVNIAIEASCNAQIGKQHSDRPFFSWRSFVLPPFRLIARFRR